MQIAQKEAVTAMQNEVGAGARGNPSGEASLVTNPSAVVNPEYARALEARAIRIGVCVCVCVCV